MKRWMSLVAVALCGLILNVGSVEASGSKKKAKQQDEIPGTGAAPVAHIKKRRSIFAEDTSQGETEDEYRRRVKKEQAATMAKQRRSHERKEMKSKGKALDKVKTTDDPDPLAGI